MTGPYAREELLRALSEQERELPAFFAGLPAQRFFEGTAERRSPAHHAQHLAQSVRPLASALATPALVKTVQFARPLAGAAGAAGWQATRAKGEPSRSYEEVRAVYREALRNGGQASGRYLPVLSGEVTQAALASELEGALSKLRRAASGWDEAALDRFQLPHPLLGLLSVRELLLFTLYHNQHHLDGVRARLEAAEA